MTDDTLGDERRLDPATDTRSTVAGWLGVLALAIGTFSLVTTELLPIGLLPQISTTLDVSIGVVGFLVTAYAALATLTAAPLTTALRRVDRRVIVIALMTLFVAGHVLAFFATSYAVLLASRLLVAVAHGVFWSVAAPIALRLVPRDQGVRSTTIVFSGISVASVLGVPLATLAGQNAGWPLAFAAVGLLGFIVLLAAVFVLPAMPAIGSVSLRSLPGLFGRPGLSTAVTVSALAMIGHYLAFTYLAPFLQQVSGFGPTGVSALLFAFGIAGVVGNFVAGAALRRSLHATIAGASTVLAASLIVMWTAGTLMPVAVVATVVWGFSYAAMPVAIQTWVLRLAPDEPDAASSLSVAAFNGAIAIGAAVGGVLADSVGVRGVSAVGAALALAAAIVLAISRYRRAADRT